MRRINDEISAGTAFFFTTHGKSGYSPENSLKKCGEKEKTHLFFVISMDFFVERRYNNSEGGERKALLKTINRCFSGRMDG